MAKVLLICGSPRKEGNTYMALIEVARQLEAEGIETEIVSLGTKPIRGCIACGSCATRTIGRCVFNEDACNEISRKAKDADGFVFGSPVYYGQPNGSLLSLVQRMLYSAGDNFRFKPVANVAVCRRGGASAAYQTMNMPFEMMNMPIVTSQYWNIGYGMVPAEVQKDEEGMQTMRQLARNMAWMLKKFHADGANDVPESEQFTPTNFIR